MDNPTIAQPVCDFLSLPDLVFLGSTCKQLEQVCKIAIDRAFQVWSKRIRLLGEIEEAAQKMERARWEREYMEAHNQDWSEEESREETNVSDEAHETEHETWSDEENNDEGTEPMIFAHMTEEFPTFRVLKYGIYRLAITKSGKDLNFYFNLKEASQGGPIKITGLHFAALYNDVGLCRLLVSRGANFQPNILIPNDQSSIDRRHSAANKMDGSDFSQYAWGYITPRRVATVLGNHQVETMLARHEEGLSNTSGVIIDRIGRQRVASIQHYTFGSVFAQQRNPGFPTIRKCDCWVSAGGDALYYINTYMHGDRVYPNILFKRTDDPMSKSSRYE